MVIGWKYWEFSLFYSNHWQIQDIVMYGIALLLRRVSSSKPDRGRYFGTVSLT